MAIYNLDSISEQEYSNMEDNNSEDILDNMLEACEYMMGQLGILDEHGGAYNRYLDMQRKKEKDAADTLNNADNIKNPIERGSVKGKAMYDGMKASRNIDKYSSPDATRQDIRDYKYKFEKDFGGPEKKWKDVTIGRKIPTSERRRKGDSPFRHDTTDRDPSFAASWNKDILMKTKYGKQLAKSKKKAVKEACLTILSALDDIDECED